jgi:hypothetical protein
MMGGCGGGNSGGGGSSSGGTGDAGTDTSMNMPETSPPDTGMGMDTSMEAAPPPPACATPSFSPMAGMVTLGTNVVISAANLPAYPAGLIFFTTDGTLPTHSSPVYTGGTTGVQLSKLGNETIQAIAYAQGVCSDSMLGSAMYTVTMPTGTGPTTPIFNPQGAQTFSNAQNVTIDSSNETAICYTLDGTMPACSASGACAKGQTYTTGGTGVSIPPSGSPSATGSYTLSAIACAAGAMSTVETQTYTLKAAQPTSSQPAGTVTWTSGISTALATTTTGATVYYTFDGTAPQCGMSMTPTNGHAPLQSGTLTAIACETGFAPSDPLTVQYSVTLNAPVDQGATTTNLASLTASVNDATNVGAGDWICFATGPAASITKPVCGTASNTCTSGTVLGMGGGSTFNAATGQGTIPVNTSGTEIMTAACAPATLTSSAASTGGPYTIQLSDPAVLPTGQTTQATSYTVMPNTTVALSQPGQGLTPPDVAASFGCYIKNPTGTTVAACGTTSGTCAVGSTKVASVPAAPGGTFTSVSPGDALSVILCTTTAGISASNAVTFSFVGAGTALPPAISHAPGIAPGATYFSPTTPVLINTNPSPVTACFTSDGSTPTCSAGTCSHGTSVALGGASSQQLAFKVGSGGSGFSAAPAATLTLPGGTCSGQQPTTALTGNAVSGVSLATPCTGITDLPTVTIAGGGGAAFNAAVENDVVVTLTNTIGATTGDTLSFTLNGGGGNGACSGQTAVLAAATLSYTLTGCGTGYSAPPQVVVQDTTAGVTLSGTASLTQQVTFSPVNGGAGYGTTAPTVAISGGGGTCTTGPVATLGGGSVASVSTATGCSGFTSSPTVSFSGNATATALPSNMAPLPAAIDTDATAILATACSASLAAPANAANLGLYHFDLADAQFNPPGTVNLGQPVTVFTTSTFADAALYYTTDGSNPVCPATGVTAHGTLISGNSGQIPAGSLTPAVTNLRAIACGANQVSQNPATSIGYNVAVAPPVIVTTVGSTTIPTLSTGGGGFIVNAQNAPVTATINSPSPGTYLCYGTANLPSCNGSTASGCDQFSTKAATGVQVNMPSDGSILLAVACSPNGTMPFSSGYTFLTSHLFATQVVFGAASNTCGGTTTVGLDPSAANGTEGGPSTGATICYGATPITSCPAPASPPLGVTCFTPAAGALSANVTTNTQTLYAISCLTGFVSQVAGRQLTQGEGAATAAYASTVNIGNPVAGQWSAADQWASSSAGVSGGYTHNAANLFFETDGFTVAANTFVMVYLWDGSAAQTTTGLGGETLPLGASFAIATDSTNAGNVKAYTWNGTMWDNGVSGFNSAVGTDYGAAISSNTFQAAFNPLSDVVPSTSGDIYVFGDVIAGFGGTATVSGKWPQVNSAWGYVADNVLSCQTPTASLK